MEEMLILVDQHDHVLGYARRSACHAGDGKLHRAVVVLLFNGKGELLLQRRRSHLWDSYWDLTGATHPRHHVEGDESYEAAATRCLSAEWLVPGVPDLERVLAYTYFARFGRFCENEYCFVFTGHYDGPITFNPAFAYDMRWASLAECRQEMAQRPSQYTPWARIAVEKLREPPTPSR